MYHKFLGNALNKRFTSISFKIKEHVPKYNVKNNNKTDAEILKTIAFLM